MSFEQLSLLLTTVTAIVAILGPIVSTIISICANKNLKKVELYAPRVYTSIQRLSDAYAQIPRKADYNAASDLQRSALPREAASACRNFAAAGYELMALISDSSIHTQIGELIADLDDQKFVTPEHDKKYQSLASAIAAKVSADYSAK